MCGNGDDNGSKTTPVDSEEQLLSLIRCSRDYICSCNPIEPFVRELQTNIRATKNLAEKLYGAGGNMYHVATLGNVELLEYLLELGVDVNSKGKNGVAGLHVAAKLDYHHVASWLIENGADVNALDKRGDSALHASAENGSKDVMKILLEHGADYEHTGRRDGCTPIELASEKVNYGERFVECLELLHEYGAKTTSEKTREKVLSNYKFDEKLLSDIRLGRRLEGHQLNEYAVEARDHEGTLLHHAARHGNRFAAERLIAFGSKVDVLEAGLTPLMLAVQHGRRFVVEVLLEANANIDITDDRGRSALEMALERDFFASGVWSFIHVLRAKTRTTNELADILLNAGAKIYHAYNTGDMKLMEYMLERGIDVDSRGHRGKTGLHEAASCSDVKCGEWLIDRGADVNVVDDDGQSPLLLAASIGCKDLLKILLERGADPNFKNRFDESTPLYAIFEKLRGPFNEKTVECVELLLRYGAIPQNSSTIFGTIFDHALYRSSDEAIRLLISQLAMLEMRGVLVTKSVMRCEDPNHRSEVSKFEEINETCRRLLEIAVFGKVSLADLLNGSERKLESLARNEEFVTEVRKVCSERKLQEMNSYYFKRVMERVDRASRVVMLQNEAIPVICKLLDGNYEECHIFARKIVDYLNVSELGKLIVMAETLLC